MFRGLIIGGIAGLALGVLIYSFWPRTGSASPMRRFDLSTQRPLPAFMPWENDPLVPMPIPTTTFSETKANAEKGDVNAQAYLGLMYDVGNGVPKDSAEAVEWYPQSC